MNNKATMKIQTQFKPIGQGDVETPFSRLCVDISKINILFCIIFVMAEAGIAIFIATAIALAIVTAIQFVERAYRKKRLEQHKYAGTYGFEYQGPEQKKVRYSSDGKPLSD